MRQIAPVLTVVCAGTLAQAQTTLDWPVSDFRPYFLDSGLRANPEPASRPVFMDVVAVNGADWLRLHFPRADLAQGSFIRVTSLLDGQSQVLDDQGLALWGGTSAYFNGGAVLVELVAAPQSLRNSLSIGQVEVSNSVQAVGGSGQCGICGNDDRSPSSELWSARFLPAGCTASVYTTSSCMVSAGHCIGGSMVVEFNVPPSNSNCSLNHPPVADQFPIVSTDFVNGGVGNDWSVLTTGTNNLGQHPYDRYGQLRPIATAPASNNQPVNIWGYGVDLTCVNSQVQQISSGNINSVNSGYYTYDADVRGGNSGSALMHTGEIIAVVTHCSVGCPNYGTRVDLPAFAAAISACGGGGGGPVEASLLSLAIATGTLAGGNLASLDNSDDDRLQIAAAPSSGNKFLSTTDVDLVSPATPVTSLSLTTEVGLSQSVNNLKTKIQIRNWSNNAWVNVDTYSQSAADDSNVYNLGSPNNYVRASDGRIQVRITTTANNAPGYTARIDHVQVVVTP